MTCRRGLVLVKCLLLVLLLVALNELPAQDSSAMQIRKFDQAALEKYRHQPDFEYEAVVSENPGFFQLIMHYLSRLFRQLFSEDQEVTIFRVLAYALMVVSVVLIILNLLGIDIRSLFVREPQMAISNSIAEENIREMNPDELIARAFAAQQWRLAIRYQYLKALRLLTDKELIRWQAGKTNMDYYYELKSGETKKDFLEVTGAFENAWYGNTEVTEAHYLQTRQQFDDFYSRIKQYSK